MTSTDPPVPTGQSTLEATEDHSVSAMPLQVLVVSEDADLKTRLRKLDLGHSTPIEVAGCARVADLGPMLERRPGFDILVAGEPLSGSNGLARLALIREELPTLTVVIAFDSPPSSAPAEIIRAGAVDMVDLSTDDDARLGDALHRAVSIRRGLGVDAASEAMLAADHHGKVFAVASASGGAGKTFLTVNLAWFIAHVTSQRVLIIDLDLQFGEVSAALHLQPRYSIADLIRYDEGQWYLTEYFEDFTTEHESGVHVLAAPREPSDAWGITPADVDRVVAAARRRFDYVVIDTSPTISDAALNALHVADSVLVIATADVPSIRNMRVFLETIERYEVPSDKIALVLNKAEKGLGLEPQVVQKLFPQGFASTIPLSRDVSRSLNAGEPVLMHSLTSSVSRAVLESFRHLIPDLVESVASGKAKSKTGSNAGAVAGPKSEAKAEHTSRWSRRKKNRGAS